MPAMIELLNKAPVVFPADAPANAIFIWVPKNAGTSVFDALRRGAGFSRFKRIKDLRKGFEQLGRVTFGHMDCKGLTSNGYVDQRFYDSAFKFGVVRDPYTRAVSLFLYLKKEGRIKPATSFLDFCELLNDGSVEAIGLYNSKGLSQCNPQVTWFRGIELDYLGRYEDLIRSFNEVATIFKMPSMAPLLHLNSSENTAYDDFYCPRSREIVETYYVEDFQSFGYEYRVM